MFISHISGYLTLAIIFLQKFEESFISTKWQQVEEVKIDQRPFEGEYSMTS